MREDYELLEYNTVISFWISEGPQWIFEILESLEQCANYVLNT